MTLQNLIFFPNIDFYTYIFINELWTFRPYFFISSDSVFMRVEKSHQFDSCLSQEHAQVLPIEDIFFRSSSFLFLVFYDFSH